MGIEDVMFARRENAIKQGISPVPATYQNVSKAKIQQVLTLLDLSNPNIVDAVFALLCDEPNWNTNAASSGFLFSDGATVAHIGTHIGILQRGGIGKLDREGRDYWLKPLWQIGAIEKVTFEPTQSIFVSGHPVAKSPNSAYRLNSQFVEILTEPEYSWRSLLKVWESEDVSRERLSHQAASAQHFRERLSSSHSALIQTTLQFYVPRFLYNYHVIYIDDGDGDRISVEQKRNLLNAGVAINLHDAMPDILLFNDFDNSLWVIEIVCSDGEVDLHKKVSLEDFARRNNKSGIGFTTVYQGWKRLSERQSANKNLANGTFVWLAEDASKHIYIG